ncbi:MAG: DUF1844 domain-containing protein [Planctomycetes bacterium]|nr:DUF1844 domain-containing protein [Planctomycetota bacterium]
MADTPEFKIPEKKVDSSWKDEIRKERELLKQQADSPAPASKPGKPGANAGAAAGLGAEGAPAAKGKGAPAPEAPAGEPKPNKVFMNFLSGLVQQALMQLGQMENPFTGGKDLDLEGARYTVELLAVIQEKTKGNLSGQEDRALTEALRELKMSYVEIANEVSKQMQDQLKKGPPPKR